MQNLFELVARVEVQAWGVAGTCRLKNPLRINVNDFGLRQALLQNRFELVGGGYEPCRLKNPPTINVNDFGQSRP